MIMRNLPAIVWYFACVRYVFGAQYCINVFLIAFVDMLGAIVHTGCRRHHVRHSSAVILAEGAYGRLHRVNHYRSDLFLDVAQTLVLVLLDLANILSRFTVIIIMIMC